MAFSDFGYFPVKIAGTAASVNGATVVSLRYHVEPAASFAKLGYKSASTLPLPSSSDVVGSSSSVTITMRVGVLTSTAAGAGLLLNVTRVAGDTPTKSNANTTGAMAR